MFLLKLSKIMNNTPIKIKLSYITGLKDVVLNELKKHPVLHITNVAHEDDDSIYLDFADFFLDEIKELQSVARAYIVKQDSKYHPSYIFNHKSILGDLINIVIEKEREFKSFKIICAGSDSLEVRSVSKYIQENYHLHESDESDLKIHIINLEGEWEVGVQLTPRPLSVRDYKVFNMSGAMDPTVAYAVNSFCLLEKAESYLNVFSGSGTLLIEAAKNYPNLLRLVGFDNDKKHLSLSIQNIRKAGLIKKVEVKEGNIFDNPNFGKFDAIASDLPFGMLISKNENLETLYKAFIEYCEAVLNPGGRLVVYTSEYELLKEIIKKSNFKIIKTLELKFITSVNAYLRPRIIVCEFKN